MKLKELNGAAVMLYCCDISHDSVFIVHDGQNPLMAYVPELHVQTSFSSLVDTGTISILQLSVKQLEGVSQMTILVCASVSVPLLASNSMVSLGALGVIVYVTQPPAGV